MKIHIKARKRGDELEDGVCKKKASTELYQVAMLVQRYIRLMPMHLMRFLILLNSHTQIIQSELVTPVEIVGTESLFMQGWLNIHSTE